MLEGDFNCLVKKKSFSHALQKSNLPKEEKKQYYLDKIDILEKCFLKFWLYNATCGILVPWPGIKPVSCAL